MQLLQHTGSKALFLVARWEGLQPDTPQKINYNHIELLTSAPAEDKAWLETKTTGYTLHIKTYNELELIIYARLYANTVLRSRLW